MLFQEIEMSFNSRTKPREAQETVVVEGAGLAGLSFALRLARKDPTKKIVIVEAREEKLSDIRPQLVNLEKEVRRYLISFMTLFYSFAK
jgi:NADPH-dependent 2,4-dienoyl-CoA reductase/sulfur reductase-like enzyme